jgi:hypothetical protein
MKSIGSPAVEKCQMVKKNVIPAIPPGGAFTLEFSEHFC